MPGQDLNALIDQYGKDPAGGHYGIEVVRTVDAVMSNAGVRANVSPITMSTIAALEVAAHEVLSGGASLEVLANLAIGTAMELAGQLAAEALEAVGDVVPIIGAAFSFFLQANDAARARARAERIANAKQAFQQCQRTAERFEPIGSGPFNEVYPCDLFLQANPVHGGWQVSSPPIVPYLGQMLELMTENRWPGWALHFCRMYGGRAAGEPAAWGYADGPIWRSLMGSSDWPINHKLPEGHDWFPELDWYVPEFAQLRTAIRSMHPYAREHQGLPSGDGGKSLWALYQDLLYAILYVPRHPFTRPGEPSFAIKDHANFAAWAAPLPMDAALAIYGGEVLSIAEGEPYSLGVPTIFRALDYITAQGGTFPDEYRKRKIQACGGQPSKTVRSIYEMAHGWDLWTHPRHYTDQQAQNEAIGKSARFASEFARARLHQMGITPAAPSQPGNASRTLEALAAGGIISPGQASEVAGAVNGGADSGRLALMLGASAVGVGALAWLAVS